jgi:hypothetical protein
VYFISRTKMSSGNLHFYEVPRWDLCCSSENSNLRTIDLGILIHLHKLTENTNQQYSKGYRSHESKDVFYNKNPDGKESNWLQLIVFCCYLQVEMDIGYYDFNFRNKLNIVSGKKCSMNKIPCIKISYILYQILSIVKEHGRVIIINTSI